MRAVPIPAQLIVMLAVLLAPGCSRAATGARSPDPSSSGEFETIYRARQESARTRYTDADVAFMTHMIAHHAQALVMAALAPERAADASIRTLAARITSAQRDEIATMQGWLRDRGQPVPELHGAGTESVVHGMQHTAAMPGMLTPAELRALEQARGPAFDRLFLESMIRHHRGAVTMVEQLFATDGAGQDEQVFKFASDVQVDQRTEIGRMERMLSALRPGA